MPSRSESDGEATETTQAVADELDEEFDAAFGAVFGETSSPVGTGASEASASTPENAEADRLDQVQNEVLFAGIAANYARPVKDFMFELEAGSAPKEWIEVCRPILATLSDAAESMDLWTIGKLVMTLDKEMEAALQDEGPWPSKSWTERILFLYGKLVEIQPEAFVVDETDRRRESIIIHSLLRQIPDVGYVSLEKLYRVGLTSLEMLFQAGPRDLVTTAGIPEELSGLICMEVQAYRQRTENAAPEKLRDSGMERLRERVPELRRQHEAFIEASDAVDTKGKLAKIRRASRAKRHELALEIDLLLAEIGEIELVREIQSAAFGRRIERLEQFIESPETTPAVNDTDTSNDEDRETSPTIVGT